LADLPAFERSGLPLKEEGKIMATAADAQTRIEFVEAASERLTAITSADRERRFYVLASGVFLFLTIVGFRQFFLHGRSIGGAPMTPQIVPLIVAHGLAMLGWVTLLFVQSLLIVNKRTRIHMKLGVAGAVLAGVIVMLGLSVAPLSAHFNPHIYDDFGGARPFMVLALTSIVAFGALAAIGLANRRRPEVHRPMMLLATLPLMTGSIDRWPHFPWLLALAHGNVPLVHWGQILILGGLLFALHAAMTRRPSRPYAVGYAGLAVVLFVSSLVFHSAAWDQFARLVVP
jgi:FtsH-binding integral membrane protein